jgi:hypothetical protein
MGDLFYGIHEIFDNIFSFWYRVLAKIQLSLLELSNFVSVEHLDAIVNSNV